MGVVAKWFESWTFDLKDQGSISGVGTPVRGWTEGFSIFHINSCSDLVAFVLKATVNTDVSYEVWHKTQVTDFFFVVRQREVVADSPWMLYNGYTVCRCNRAWCLFTGACGQQECFSHV